MLELSKVFEGVHEYVLSPLAFNIIELPIHISLFGLMVMVGIGFIVTVTLSELTQPFPSVTDTVYKVVEDGVATGFEMFGLFKPADGDQVYVLPPVALFFLLYHPLRSVQFSVFSVQCSVFSVQLKRYSGANHYKQCFF